MANKKINIILFSLIVIFTLSVSVMLANTGQKNLNPATITNKFSINYSNYNYTSHSPFIITGNHELAS